MMIHHFRDSKLEYKNPLTIKSVQQETPPQKNPKTLEQGQGREGAKESRIINSLKNNSPPLKRLQVKMTERKQSSPNPSKVFSKKLSHKNPKIGGQRQGRERKTKSRISNSLKNNYPTLQRFQVRMTGRK